MPSRQAGAPMVIIAVGSQDQVLSVLPDVCGLLRHPVMHSGTGVPAPRSFRGSQPGELILEGSPLGVGLREVEGPPVGVPGLIITAHAAQ